MKIYWKYYIIPFVYGIIFSWYGTFHVEGKRKLWELMVDLGGGKIVDLNSYAIATIIEKQLPYILFIILFSTYIYRHFCSCSPYVFSRCENRGMWYMKETVKLFGFSFLYVLILILGRMCPGVLIGRFIFDPLGCKLLWHYLATMTLWLFQLTLLANTIAIRFGSSAGNLVMIGAQMAAVIALLGIQSYNLTQWDITRLVWNPNTYLLLNWHVVVINGKRYFGEFPYEVPFVHGYLYFGFLCISAFIIGYLVVQKVEIIGNREK